MITVLGWQLWQSMGFLLHASCPPCPPKRKFSRINWKLDTHTFWQFKSSEITSDHWFNNGKEPWIQRVQELLSHPADTWNSTSHTHSRCAPWHHPKTLPCTQLPLCIFQDPAVCFITTGDKKGSPTFSWFSLKPKHWIHTSPNIHIRQPKHSWFYLKLIVAQGSSVILDWARWWKMLAFWKGFFRWRSLCCSWTCNLLQAMWLLWSCFITMQSTMMQVFSHLSQWGALFNHFWINNGIVCICLMNLCWSSLVELDGQLSLLQSVIFIHFPRFSFLGAKTYSESGQWEKSSIFFSPLGPPARAPKKPNSPLFPTPKKFKVRLLAEFEKRKKQTGFLFDTFFEVRNHQGNRCLWKLNILNPITCSKG